MSHDTKIAEDEPTVPTSIPISSLILNELTEEAARAGMLTHEEIWSSMATTMGDLTNLRKDGYTIISYQRDTNTPHEIPSVKDLLIVLAARRLSTDHETSKFFIRLGPREIGKLQSDANFKAKFTKTVTEEVLQFIWLVSQHTQGRLIGGHCKRTKAFHQIQSDWMELATRPTNLH